MAKGSCLCGAVQFEVTPPSRYCGHCHCSLCRRAHGAPFVTWAGFRAEQVDVHTGRERLTRYLTVSGSTRTFCNQCGSTLFFEGPAYEGETHVALANIDEPIDRVPEAHFFVDHGAEWWSIDDSLPQFGGETGFEKKE